MDQKWTMDLGDQVLDANEAREWLRKVVADRELAGQYWPQIVAIDKGLELRPPLTWAACLVHRDGLMAEPEIWETLNDGLRVQMVILDDDTRDELVNMIIGNAIAHYGQPVPDEPNNDDADRFWTLRSWDGDGVRILTKDEAVQRLIGHVMAGDRPDLLEDLADAHDAIKVLLAAVPLEDTAATEALVAMVVNDVVAQSYSETGGRDWVVKGYGNE